MNKTALLFTLSLLAVSCLGSGGGSSSETTAPDVTEAQNPRFLPEVNTQASNEAISTAGILPRLALSFNTNVEYLQGFTSSAEDKYDQAVEIVKKVVATEAFRKRVLSHTYNGAKTYANNNGLTNGQIYQTILDAAEKLKPIKNNTLDVGVKLYYQNSTIVGYTNAAISYINVNTKFFNQFDTNEVAGNLFHEWLHKLGYGHDSAATARRPYSVPYAIGYIVRDLGKNFL
jgi:hypothetical protein